MTPANLEHWLLVFIYQVLGFSMTDYHTLSPTQTGRIERLENEEILLFLMHDKNILQGGHDLSVRLSHQGHLNNLSQGITLPQNKHRLGARAPQ